MSILFLLFKNLLNGIILMIEGEKMKYYIYLCLLLFLSPFVVKADACDDNLYYKTVATAELIKLVYSYNAQTQKMDVKAINVNEEFSFKINNKEIKSKTKEVVLGSFNQGEEILVNFYTSSDLGCGRNNLVTKRYLVLPFYNRFYNDERCKSRAEIDACNYYYPIALDEKTFSDMIYLYDQQIYNQLPIKEKIEKQKKIEPWYMKNKYYLLIGFGTALFILIAYVIYRIKENKIEGEL